ncbi:MAG: DUF6320 domain-containing protein [Eubacteriales bacterium]|nr:DUF6320 domain-containing protein [Eubacteriales bacterium]
MSYCETCKISVKGKAKACPLCGAHLRGVPEGEDIFPWVPLRYNQHILYKVLGLISLLLAITLWLFKRIFPASSINYWHILLTVGSFWSLVLAMVRKRRNLAKSVLYQLLLLSGFFLAWDFLIDQRLGWSLTSALPLLSCLAIVAIILRMLFVRYELGDYILYLLATALISPAALIFVAVFGLRPIWPAIVAASLGALVFTLTFIFRHKLIFHELKTRFHL